MKTISELFEELWSVETDLSTAQHAKERLDLSRESLARLKKEGKSDEKRWAIRNQSIKANQEIIDKETKTISSYNSRLKNFISSLEKMPYFERDVAIARINYENQSIAITGKLNNKTRLVELVEIN